MVIAIRRGDLDRATQEKVPPMRDQLA